MKIIAYLGGSRGYAVLLSLIANKLAPEFVYTKKTSKLNDITEICKLNSINIEKIDGKFSGKHIESISLQRPDLLIVSGFNSILPIDLLSISKYGGINCHAGRLPMYRGTAVIPWQIINGETTGEAYVLEMTAGIDDGRILASQQYSIELNETSKHVVNKVNIIFSNIIPQVIKDYLSFGNGLKKLKQDNYGVCTWTQRFPQDGIIEWDKMTAFEVVNLVRALDDPYPGAFTYLGGVKIVIKKAQVHSDFIRGVPGRYVGIRDGKVTIIASDRAVAILDYEVLNKSNNKRNFELKVGDIATNSVSF